MPTTFLDLPYELQKQILEILQKPWHLCTKQVPTFSGYPVYTFVPSAKLEKGPVFTCRAMHDISAQLVQDRFTGVLDATDTRENSLYSVMPRYKTFIPRISKVLVRDLSTVKHAGPMYHDRLPNLKVVEVIPDSLALFPNHDAIGPGGLKEALSVSCLDKEFKDQMTSLFHQWSSDSRYHEPPEDSFELHFRQAFKIPGHEQKVVSSTGETAQRKAYST